MLGVTLVLSLSSMSRIFGYLWFYLVLWSWAVTALDAARGRLDGRRARRPPGRSRRALRDRRLARGSARSRSPRSMRARAGWLHRRRRRRRVTGPEGLRGARRAGAPDGPGARRRHGARRRARRSLPGDVGGPGQHRWTGLRVAQRARAGRVHGRLPDVYGAIVTQGPGARREGLDRGRASLGRSARHRHLAGQAGSRRGRGDRPPQRRASRPSTSACARR